MLPRRKERDAEAERGIESVYKKKKDIFTGLELSPREKYNRVLARAALSHVSPALRLLIAIINRGAENSVRLIGV